MRQQENFLIGCGIPLNMGHTPILEMLQCGENVCLGSDIYDNFMLYSKVLVIGEWSLDLDFKSPQVLLMCSLG